MNIDSNIAQVNNEGDTIINFDSIETTLKNINVKH